MSIKWYVDDGGQLNGLCTLAQQPACRSKNNRLEKCAPLSCICNGFVEWPRIEMHWHFNWLASSKHHFVIWFFEPSPPPTNSGLLVCSLKMCANLIEVTLTTSIYIVGDETMCTYNLLSQIDTLQCTRISLASGKSHFYVPIYSVCVYTIWEGRANWGATVGTVWVQSREESSNSRSSSRGERSDRMI